MPALVDPSKVPVFFCPYCGAPFVWTYEGVVDDIVAVTCICNKKFLYLVKRNQTILIHNVCVGPKK